MSFRPWCYLLSFLDLTRGLQGKFWCLPPQPWSLLVKCHLYNRVLLFLDLRSSRTKCMSRRRRIPYRGGFCRALMGYERCYTNHWGPHLPLLLFLELALMLMLLLSLFSNNFIILKSWVLMLEQSWQSPKSRLGPTSIYTLGVLWPKWRASPPYRIKFSYSWRILPLKEFFLHLCLLSYEFPSLVCN